MRKINFDIYVDVISKMDLFSGFTNEELSSVFGSFRYRISQYDKGQIMHLQNEHCNTMDIILDGRASVQNIDESGRALTISVF